MKLREVIHAKCGGKCAYCGIGITIKQMQRDHVHPLAMGGADTLENQLPSCRQCNNFKNVWSLDEFRRHLQDQVNRARKYSVNFRNAERFGLLSTVEKPIVFYFETQQ